MSSLVESGVLSAEDRASAVSAGAVGNLLGRFLDRDGQEIDHPLNRLCIGVRPADILGIPVRILCAGGPNKGAAISACLRQRMANMLVTDEATAVSLLAD